MELKNLINQMGNATVTLDEHEIKIDDLLNDGKYKILKKYLSDNNIKTTNDLKRLSVTDYNSLKIGIPNLDGVGEDKTSIFTRKLDMIRNNTHVIEKADSVDGVKVVNLGKIQTSKNWFIEANYIDYGNNSEFLDIRQVKVDNTRGKGISIKRENIDAFKDMISNINLDFLYMNNSDDEQDEIEIDDDSLKQQILNNEYKLLSVFSNEYGQAINLFIKKIESLPTDGDIVKFLNNPSILDIKKDQYDLFHSNGYMTAIDIMNEYDKSGIKSTEITGLKLGDKINTMTLCALANNFNLMLGMYYNEKEDYIILKSQTSGGDYNNKWLDEKNMQYYLQNESEDKYQSLEFSHRPNQICRDIVLNMNTHTKVYLFDRSTKNEDYSYCGEVKPIKFINNNRCIVIQKKSK